jgi:hypothetical protein
VTVSVPSGTNEYEIIRLVTIHDQVRVQGDEGAGA